MATFKATIFKDRQREDKTWSVFIRFTHERKVRYLPTSISVSRKDLTASMRIKNQQVIDKCNDIIYSYRQRIATLDLEVNDFDIDSIVDFIRKMKSENGSISFTSYFDDWVKEHSSIKGLRNYQSAFNSFKNYIRKDEITHMDITVKSLKGFCEYLKDKPRAQSLYASSIMRVFNDMRDFYNDEDNGIIRIRHSLSKFTAPKQNVAEQRALSIEIIRNLFSLNYDNIRIKGMPSRHDLALDCFKLSFCLMGMNSADLYNATEYDSEYITYNRTKTKDRRTDNAKMIVKVYPFIKQLIDKYRGKSRVFNFCERYSSMADFNRAINIGLKSIGEEIGVKDLQFYAARHSFATIAVNEVGIPIYLVNDMLCHIDSKMRVTLLYIKKKFDHMNEANFKLLDFVLTSL